MDKEVRIIKHQNVHDVEKVEFSLNEIEVKINNRILKKLNRQNNKRR